MNIQNNINKKIAIDQNIPYFYIFNRLGKIILIDGYKLSARELIEIDALIVRSVTKINNALLQNSAIKFVGSVTSGIDHIDIQYLTNSGIYFASAAGCNTIAVVEYIFSVLFWLAEFNNFNLLDKTVGIIGVGNIGKCLNNRLKTIGIHTLLCDPILEKYEDKESWQSLEKLVSDADILTFHVPLTIDGPYATWHTVNTEFLEALSNNKIIINTSRGAVIDNTALLQVMQKRKKLSLVLDVWESKSIISSLLPYISIGTTHIAGATIEAKMRGIIKIFNSYNDFILNYTNKKFISLENSLKPIKYIKLKNRFNEKILKYLINIVYDIRKDNIVLRKKNFFPETFNKLRDHYLQRREWSSICIETMYDDDAEKLIKLGFKVC